MSVSSVGSSGSGSNSSTSALNGVTPTNQGVVTFTGLGSGLNYQSIIAELTKISQQQEVPYQNKINTINSQNTELTTIQNLLSTLQTSMQALSDPNTFNSYSATPSTTGIVNAATTPGAVPVAGTYTINSTTLGTSTSVVGANTIGYTMAHTINGTAADNVPLAQSYAQITPTNGGVSSGTVTIDGVKITYDVTSQSLEQILANIQSDVQAAGDTGFTASYNAATDKVTLASSDQPISFGATTDTGNLLSVLKLDTAQLTNTSTSGTVTSSAGVGGVNLYATLDSSDSHGNALNAGFRTPVTSGTFTINGVSITVNTATQALSDIIKEINSSGAGVTASFSTQTGQLTLVNNSVGAQSIVLGSSGDTSNFLHAAGLTSSVTAANFATSGVTAGNITINGTSIAIDPTTQTLAQVEAAINASAANVTASINAQTGNLQIVNNGGGTPTIGASGDTSNFLDMMNASGSAVTLGTQTSITYKNASGGTSTAYSNDNTISNAIQGVTLTVQSSTATAFTVTVAQSSKAAETAIGTFVTNYNAVINELNAATAAPVVTQNGNTSSSAGGGVFFGNSIIEQLKNQLVNLVSAPISNAQGGYNSLASIGLKLDSSFSVLTSGSSSGTSVSGVTNTSAGGGLNVTTYQGTDGAFQQLDTAAFEAAFASNPNAVANLFTSSNSFVMQVGSLLTDETGIDTILANGVAGKAPATSVLKGLQNQNAAIIQTAQNQITQLQKQITNQANMLNAEYQAASSVMSSLQSEQTYLSQIGGSSATGG